MFCLFELFGWGKSNQIWLMLKQNYLSCVCKYKMLKAGIKYADCGLANMYYIFLMIWIRAETFWISFAEYVGLI